MTSESGIIFRGLMDDAGYTETSFQYSSFIFIASVLFSLLLIAGFRYIPRNNKNIGKGSSFAKPEPFDKKQKINLYLMIAMILVVLIFPILNIILPNNAGISYINSKMDVGLSQ